MQLIPFTNAYMLTGMIHFTCSTIKKGSRVGEFVLEKSMSIESKGKWEEKPGAYRNL